MKLKHGTRVSDWLIAISIAIAVALQGTALSGVQGAGCYNTSTDLPSADDYMHQDGMHSLHEVPELGMEVADGKGRLTTGTYVRGVRVIRVFAGGPAARAGLRDEHRVGKMVVVGALLALGLFFPPVIFVDRALENSSDLDSYGTIIAVDSERIQDLLELQNIISRSSSGPVVYLSMIRGGRREQIRIYLNNGNSSANKPRNRLHREQDDGADRQYRSRQR
jgi:PDZ domain-containing protein